MRKDTCIAGSAVAFRSLTCRVLSSLSAVDGCSDNPSTGGGAVLAGRPNVWEFSGVEDASVFALAADTEDLLGSGTVAMEKVSLPEACTASHRLQHTMSASVLQL